jgi:hypothetical protein
MFSPCFLSHFKKSYAHYNLKKLISARELAVILMYPDCPGDN